MRTLRIGTRGSALALAQTQLAIDAIEYRHHDLKGRIEVVPIKTTGDTIVDRSLTDIGGKSLFTKEIENALLAGTIDLAIHSMKDMAAEAPPGLIVPAMLEREDPRDALITREGQQLEDLPEGSLFGTSSLRRQAHVLHKYPHFQTASLRGAVPTRLRKIESGEFDATLLAVAGLKRLNLLEKATQIFSLNEFIPAVGQGAIGIQCREDDHAVADLLESVNHFPTFQSVVMERAFLKALQGSCRTPLAGYAYLEGETLFFQGMISDPLGQNMRFISQQGPVHEAESMGIKAAESLRAEA